jgi:FG-GAP repeat protein
MTTLFERAAVAAVLAIAACSSSPSTHTVGGRVHGIWDGADGVGLQLEAQGVKTLLTVPSNGDFEFPTPLAPGASYVVTVLASPYLHDCAIQSGGNGVVGDDVTSLSIGCTGPEVQVEFSGGHGWTFDPTADSQSFDGSVFDDQVTLTVRGLVLTGAMLDLSAVQFGVARPVPLALSGTTAVLQVTAPANLSRKFTFMFHRGPTPLAQSSYAKPSHTGAHFEFGSAVAIDGDTLVIGAPLETVASTSGADVPNTGAAYVFVRSGDSWSQQARLTPPVVSDTFLQFGKAVAVSGNTIAIGMPNDPSGSAGVGGNPADISLLGSGAVVVFVRSGTSWTQQAYIKATNPGQIDNFGAAVALDGDVLAVGAPFEDSAAIGVDPIGGGADSDAQNAGAAYTYRRTGTSWARESYIKPSLSTHDSLFGTAIALSGDTLAIGAPGEASSARGIDGNQSDASMMNAGAAYVFVRGQGGVWGQQAYVKAVNTGAGDRFGGAIAVLGDTMAVAANFETGLGSGTDADPQMRGGGQSGAVYVYRRSPQWSSQAYLKASTMGQVSFGSSLALSGDLLAVGSIFEPGGATDPTTHTPAYAGGAYVFGKIGDRWTMGARVVPSNGDTNDQFGTAVAIARGTLVVGAKNEASATTAPGDNSAEHAGAIYMFR